MADIFPTAPVLRTHEDFTLPAEDSGQISLAASTEEGNIQDTASAQPPPEVIMSTHPAVEPGETSLDIVSNSLDLFDSSLELLSTAVSSVPLPFLWHTLQQCPSTIMQSLEASLCVMAQISRRRQLHMLPASSHPGSVEWLKREVSGPLLTCTGQRTIEGPQAAKVLP
jgi:hypothetical protein